MTISDDEILSIIDETTVALGQILLRHRALSESLLDTQQTERGKEEIDSLKKRIEDERANLAKIRHSQRRRKELDRIRSAHEKEAKDVQTEQKNGMVSLLNQGGKLIGWIQTIGRNRVNILNAHGKVVAREIDGRTFDGKSRFAGRGNQGLRVLGTRLKK
jgi:hypothetical protein